MNALVKKEIRLLLPAYVMALLLAIVPVWLVHDDFGSYEAAVYLSVLPFLFGALMLALSSFGREFGLGTSGLMLAQPLELGRLWWTKVGLLAAALATVFGVWHRSCLVRLTPHGTLWASYMGLYRYPTDPERVRACFSGVGIMVIVAFASGLWTTLLLRQMVTAFWASVLVPIFIVGLVSAIGGSESLCMVVLAVYSAAAFLLCWRLFPRMQEVAWTGGAVTLPKWRSASATPGLAARTFRPWAALFWKEVQFYQVCLAGMAGLFVVHLGVVVLRTAAFHNDHSTTMGAALWSFGIVWGVVPLLIGCMSVAEERRLGTLEGQMCLPFSSRVQFAIKLIFALAVGGLLSAGLCWTAEAVGPILGVGDEFPTSIFGIFLGLSLAGFWASTMSRGLLQALAVVIVCAMVLVLLRIFTMSLLFGGVDMSWCPAVALLVVWSAYRNFMRMPARWGVTAAHSVFTFLAALFFLNFASTTDVASELSLLIALMFLALAWLLFLALAWLFR